MKHHLRNAPLLCASMCLVACLCSCSADLDDDYPEATRTSDDAPAVSTPEYSISVSTVTLTAQMTGVDDYTVRNYGFVYSSEDSLPGYTVTSTNKRKRVTNVDDDGYFSTDIDLDQGLQYWVRAYIVAIDAESVSDTIFSEPITFTIDKSLPVIELLPITNRAKRGACAFAKFTSAGNVSLTKWGISYSTTQYPTVDDDGETANDTCTYEGFEGEFGAFFQVLEPQTLYYVRAWVVTPSDTVYSNQRMFRTTEGGRYSWAWASNYSGAVSAGADGNIETAMDSAAYYYNNYSNLYLSASVEYNTGVTTADCSYGGWIRFGANTWYQWVGTAQHETSHGLGVGTASNWTTLIDYGSTGVWQGECGQRTCRAVMRDQTQKLQGDSQHMWPGGINQRTEVTTGTTNSYNETIKDERMLRGNAMICNALQIDGLACP